MRTLPFMTLLACGLLMGITSCGGDEGTEDDGPAACTTDRECREPRVCVDIDGNRNQLCEPSQGETCRCEDLGGVTGGTGGTGGATLGGSGGSVTGGTGGTSGGSSMLGAPCADDAACGNLQCLTSTAFGGEGPPGGMCTAVCSTPDECLEFGSNAVCLVMAVDENGMDVGFCVEGCTPGPTTVAKCHARSDFACDLIGITPTTASCASSAACAQDEICIDALCQTMTTACAPRCGSDADCETDQFCDLGSGLCVSEDSTDLPIGALCDPSLPADQDPCEGFCIPTDATETEGTCAALCSLNQELTGCGWDGTGPADAACLYATVVARDAAGDPDPGFGDLMLCGQLCDCNDDCPAEIEYCVDETAEGFIQQLFGRQGYCRPLIAPETEADTFSECPAASGP